MPFSTPRLHDLNRMIKAGVHRLGGREFSKKSFKFIRHENLVLKKLKLVSVHSCILALDFAPRQF